MPQQVKPTSTLYALMGYALMVAVFICAGAFVLGYIPVVPGPTP